MIDDLKLFQEKKSSRADMTQLVDFTSAARVNRAYFAGSDLGIYDIREMLLPAGFLLIAVRLIRVGHVGRAT